MFHGARWLLIVLVIGTYLLSFSVNLIPSLKHPDSILHIHNLIVSILFTVVLLIITKLGSKKIIFFSLVGIVAGVLVYLLQQFEDILINNVVLDTIASIQYPLYILFITPIFGVNLFFNLDYGVFSLVLAIFYCLILGLTIYFFHHYSRRKIGG